MKQSELFTTTLRQAPKDEESRNAELLIRAGFIEKVMAGVYAFLPLGLRVIKKIENIIREEILSLGGQEIFLSSLQPRSVWEQTGRWNTLDVLFKFTSFYSKNDYALGPTHEEILTPIIQKYVSSYKDLPLAVFQIQNKFRDEKRPKTGLLRGREFLMKDLYSFHVDEKDLNRFYDRTAKAYLRIFKKAGIGEKTYLTYASGGTFSKYSHEFQTLTPAGEDTIYVCDQCRLAINKEIIDDQSACPKCGNKILREEKAVEVGNIFKLRTKFSEPFGLKFKDKKGAEHNVEMGCYGLGLSRLMGTIVEVNNDEKGMIWPENVAPYRFHLLELKKGLGKKIYQRLLADGIEVLYDDRGVSAGEKFADADLIGLPYRLVVSEKTGSRIELKRRASETKKMMKYEDIRRI